MDLIYSFRRLLYAQVLLGILAYAIATRAPELALLGLGLGALSWWVAESGRRQPPARWLTNLGVVIATLWMMWAHFALEVAVLANLGHFLLILQLIKLFERKSDRDDAELMVLSLGLVLCGMLEQTSLGFGLVLTVYLLVSLATCLQFQLKRSYSEAFEAAPIAALGPRIPGRAAAQLAGLHRRRLRGVAVACAVLVGLVSTALFVSLPRGQPTTAMLGQSGIESRAGSGSSGFADQIELTGGRRITQNDQPVFNVRIMEDRRNLGSRQRRFLLRGTALDLYESARGRWVRSPQIRRFDRGVLIEGDRPLALPGGRAGGSLWRQEVTLRGRSGEEVFALGVPVRIRSAYIRYLETNAMDQVLRVRQRTGETGRSGYEVWSTPMRVDEAGTRQLAAAAQEMPPRYARGPVLRHPALEELVQTILESEGLSRQPTVASHPDDVRIAEAIQRYLEEHCAYTLDLPPVPQGMDPIVAFLFHSRAGHCEYFAAAMAAMLRTAGLRARVINGYAASEYNAIGGYYVVREKHAHAWVEAWIDGAGWISFDPSPRTVLDRLHRPSSGLAATWNDLHDYLETFWIDNIVAFDGARRRNLVTGLREGLISMVENSRTAAEALMERLRSAPEQWVIGRWGYTLLAVIVGALLIAVGVLIQVCVVRRRISKELEEAGVDPEQRRQLRRQLKLYLQMLQVLRRAGYEGRGGLTPVQFARQLERGRNGSVPGAVALVEEVYAFRFGGRILDLPRLREVRERLDALHARVRGTAER